MSPKRIYLQAGQEFNRLTVVKLDHIKTIHPPNKTENREFYLCKCKCGNTTIVEKFSLKSGNTRSCGCYKKEKIITHGLTKNRIYKTWSRIKKRCYNKNDKSHYPNYGGRGITVCDEWKNDFMAFYNWAMDNGYKDNLSIDRIDVNGNYEPSNCRWVSIKIQERNRRNNRLITYKGETRCLTEWAEIVKLKPQTINSRLSMGWSVERTLESNVMRRNKK